MRVLVTGASGYLGQHLLDHLATFGHELYAAYGSLETFEADYGTVCEKLLPVDLAVPSAVQEMLAEVQPEAVVHLAAISSPVACDKDQDQAMAVNVPIALIDALPSTATLIFLSTDQVYDGLAAPYSESSPAEPVNTYGRSKLAFEQACTEKLPTRSVCLRSSLILGPPTRGRCRKQSFLQFCDERLQLDGQTTQFFSDEFRSVVYVGDIAKLIAWFVEGGVARAPGVYNMGGPSRVTRVARASLPPGPTASPPDIAMDSSKLAAVTGVTPTSLEELVAFTFA